MVTVALAGAATGPGLVLLRQLTTSPKHAHKIILLSRSPRPDLEAHGVEVRQVDYSSHESLTKGLQGVHTLLSFLGGTATALHESQLALVAAAKEAGVKRFAPSEFAVRGGGYELSLYAGKKAVWEAAKASEMEVTRFSCGIFMGFLGSGTPKGVTEVGVREAAESGEQEALGGLRPWDFVVNCRAGTADLPGDGSAEVVLTDTRDVAKFVEAALVMGDGEWEEEMGMRGEVVSWKRIVEVLEEVQGRKFLVRENSVEDLERMIEENEALRRFPDIRPLGVEEFVKKWWEGVQLGEPKWTEDRMAV
ncbi:hypothetical protein Q7P37_010956 [Cladosporium fusiforme]